MPLSETGVERITGFFFPVGLVLLAWFGKFVYPVWHICTACEPDLAYFLAWFGIILSLEPCIIFSHDLKGVCNTFIPNGFVNNVDHLWHDFKSTFVSAADRHAPIIQRRERDSWTKRSNQSCVSGTHSFLLLLLWSNCPWKLDILPTLGKPLWYTNL